MYDAKITILRRSPVPVRVSNIEAEARVKELAESFLAAWGLPFPRTLQDTKESTFADRLAKAGEYQHHEDDFSIIVTRSDPQQT